MPCKTIDAHFSDFTSCCRYKLKQIISFFPFPHLTFCSNLVTSAGYSSFPGVLSYAQTCPNICFCFTKYSVYDILKLVVFPQQFYPGAFPSKCVSVNFWRPQERSRRMCHDLNNIIWWMDLQVVPGLHITNSTESSRLIPVSPCAGDFIFVG